MSFVPAKTVKLWPCGGDRLVSQRELYHMLNRGDILPIAQVTETYIASAQDVRNQLGNFKFAPDVADEESAY